LATLTLSMDALLFTLEGQRFALPARDLVEIVRAVAVRPIPGAPSVVLGALDLRSTLVAVVDIRARFGLTPRPLGLDDHFVVARAGTRTIAIIADRADDYGTIDDSAIDATAAISSHAPHLGGVARTTDGLVVLVDLETFLTQAEEASLQAALAPS
ncbi:MAG: chemotaxis protein CheW, partial [Polyangiales bacterium]